MWLSRDWKDAVGVRTGDACCAFGGGLITSASAADDLTAKAFLTATAKSHRGGIAVTANTDVRIVANNGRGNIHLGALDTDGGITDATADVFLNLDKVSIARDAYSAYYSQTDTFAACSCTTGKVFLIPGVTTCADWMNSAGAAAELGQICS
jgi:hypothetical protein